MPPLLRHLAVAAVGFVSVIYLINPGAGFIEFIPDNAPLVGNLDEAAATALLLACLSYFGLDLTKAFGRKTVEDDKANSQRD
jgi:hypothetical protein